MARNLLPWMIVLGVLLFGLVVMTGMRVAKWRQPGGQRAFRLRRRQRPPKG